jgi:hypothetical protein
MANPSHCCSWASQQSFVSPAKSQRTRNQQQHVVRDMQTHQKCTWEHRRQQSGTPGSVMANPSHCCSWASQQSFVSPAKSQRTRNQQQVEVRDTQTHQKCTWEHRRQQSGTPGSVTADLSHCCSCASQQSVAPPASSQQTRNQQQQAVRDMQPDQKCTWERRRQQAGTPGRFRYHNKTTAARARDETALYHPPLHLWAVSRLNNKYADK